MSTQLKPLICSCVILCVFALLSHGLLRLWILWSDKLVHGCNCLHHIHSEAVYISSQGCFLNSTEACSRFWPAWGGLLISFKRIPTLLCCSLDTRARNFLLSQTSWVALLLRLHFTDEWLSEAYGQQFNWLSMNFQISKRSPHRSYSTQFHLQSSSSRSLVTTNNSSDSLRDKGIFRACDSSRQN